MFETRAHIEGMACTMCETHINEVIRKNFSVKKVKSSRRKNETVILSEGPLDDQRLKQVIEETGYHYMGMTQKEV